MTNPLKLPIKNSLLRKIVTKFTALDAIHELYDDWLNHNPPNSVRKGVDLLDFSLKYMNIDVHWSGKENLSNIPQEGPLVIIANHPLGGLEGMLLARELIAIRPDIKVITNELLLRFPEFKDIFIGVDVLSENTSKNNTLGIRRVTKHLSDRGALLIFPAGTVSKIDYKHRIITDNKWSDIAARLVRKYQCPCIPFYINEKNPLWFYLSALIHKRIRTALIARAMISKKNTTVEIVVGDKILPQEIKSLETTAEVTHYLRLCCEVLSSKNRPIVKNTQINETIKPDIKQNKLLEQLQCLDKYQIFKRGNFSVYCAPYAELGCVMEQIAITREKTFRAASEGTGKELDSDQFDPCYNHLWVWDDVAQKLVGGYRIGKVDEIIKVHGVSKLYSNSLYNYKQKFIDNMDGYVEVGRSFVSVDYQRHSKALDLLWRGIGSYMVANPECHTLFGCVSVSQAYSNMAKALLVDSLLMHFNAKQEFLNNVKPKMPLKINGKPWSESMISSLSNVPIINKLLGRIDSGKTIPILIRHYLALNGKFASFTVNKNFNHSLDGLIIVDLRLTPQKYLSRYLGKEGAEKFIYKWISYETVA